MKNGTKIKTKHITYEIEVMDISKEVPKEQEIDFIEWLSGQTNEHGTGKHNEHFSYTENYKDDIEVTFYIKSV